MVKPRRSAYDKFKMGDGLTKMARPLKGFALGGGWEPMLFSLSPQEYGAVAFVRKISEIPNFSALAGFIPLMGVHRTIFQLGRVSVLSSAPTHFINWDPLNFDRIPVFFQNKQSALGLLSCRNRVDFACWCGTWETEIKELDLTGTSFA